MESGVSMTEAALLLALADSSPDLVVVTTDREGRITSFSPAALLDYFRVVNYDFDAAAAASLVLFAHHCRELGLIPAVPALRYAL